LRNGLELLIADYSYSNFISNMDSIYTAWK